MEKRNIIIDEIKSGENSQLNGVDVNIISGYGSVFGVVDAYKDVVQPTAFGNVSELKNLPLKLEHEDVVGTITELSVDEKGLKFVAAIPSSDKVLVDRLKLGAFKTSIGFKTKKDSYDDNVRFIEDIDLKEISLVGTPANEYTSVDEVKKEKEDSEESQEQEPEEVVQPEEPEVKNEPKQTEMENKENEALGIEIKKMSEQLSETQRELMDLKNAEKQEVKVDPLEEVKSNLLKVQNKEITEVELKADLFNSKVVNGATSITSFNENVFDTPVEPNILDSFTRVVVPSGMSKAGWTEFVGGNAIEIGEGSFNVSNDQTESEYSRNLSMIGRAQKISDIHLANPNYKLAEYVEDLNSRVRLLANREVFNGSGAETAGNQSKIFGLLTQGLSTANTIKTGLSTFKSAAPDMVDLIRAIAGFIRNEGFMPNSVYLNESDYVKITALKSTTGAPLYSDLEQATGLKIYKAIGVTAGKVVVADSTKVKLFVRDAGSLKVERINNDSIAGTVHIASQMALQVVLPSNVKNAVVIGDFTKVDDWLKK